MSGLTGLEIRMAFTSIENFSLQGNLVTLGSDFKEAFLLVSGDDMVEARQAPGMPYWRSPCSNIPLANLSSLTSSCGLFFWREMWTPNSAEYRRPWFSPVKIGLRDYCNWYSRNSRNGGGSSEGNINLRVSVLFRNVCKRFTLDLLPRVAESPQDKRLMLNLEQSVLATTMSPLSRPTGRTLVNLFIDCFTCPAHFPAKASWGTGFSRNWGSTITHCSFRKLRERMGKDTSRGPFPKRFVKCMHAQKTFSHSVNLLREFLQKGGVLTKEREWILKWTMDMESHILTE